MATSHSRAESPSRGKMTITLHSNANEPEETAKVRIEVNNPELVAERVVTQLARKFPPESVVTISTGAGAATTDEEDDDCSRASTHDQSSVCSSQRRRHRLRVIEEPLNSMSEGPPGLVSFQFYLVTDELDMAVPLEDGQRSVRLFDRSTQPVKSNDVYTVFYDETGHAFGSARGFCSEYDDEEPLPQKRGIATFVQDYALSDELEKAVPICPGQTVVHLADDTTMSIQPQEVHTVAYGSKGLAIFSRDSSGAVVPGVPRKPGIAHAAIPHRVSSKTQARPIASSEAVLPPKPGVRPPPKNVHVVLYDNQGTPICTRTPYGGLIPEGLPQAGAASQLEYYWTPHSKHSVPAGRIATMNDQKVTLVSGETVQIYPDDVSLFLRGPTGKGLGGFLSDRRPSFVPGPISEVLPQVARKFDSELTNRHRPAPKKVDDFQSQAKRLSARQKASSEFAPSPAAFRRKNSPPPVKSPKARTMRPEMAWAEKDDSLPFFAEDEEDTAAAMKILRRDPQSESFCRSQTYFIPDDINYAIPVMPDQSHVKLSNGDRIDVDNRSCVTVDYDFRGFPMQTHFFDGRVTPWMISRPGIGAKFQDYFVHSDLLFAVPVRPGQTQVILSDGSSVPVPSLHITCVFYDSGGKPVFTLTKAQRKVRPGLLPKPGIAATLQYLNLLDAEDGTGEQFVVPFKACQSDIRDPRDPSQHIPVDRRAIIVAFFDKNRQPLYSQLVDGSLVGGGLLGSRQLTTTDDDDDSLSTTSDRVSTYDFQLPYTEHARRVSLAQMSSSASFRKLARVNTTAPKNNSTSRIPEVFRRPKNVTRNVTQTRVPGSSKPAPMSEDCSVRSRRQEIIERRVPVQQVEYIEKIVEVPEVHIVDKHVEVEQIEWQTKIVKKKEIVERPVEHVKYVPKIETKVVERVIEVPQIIEVPRPEIIEQRVKVDRFVDVKKNVPVSQRISPVIRGDCSDFFEEVECLTLEPDLIPVDVFVPRLVKSRLVAIGVTGEAHQEVEVPLAHYNSLVLKMNPMFANNYEKLPMIKTTSGCFPLLPADQQVTVLAPTADEITQVLKAAGVVSRQATQTEMRQTRKNRARIHKIEDETDVMSEFAPRTSIIK